MIKSHEDKKILVKTDDWHCHHCNGSIYGFRYVYGKNSYCESCHNRIDELITKIAEW